MFERAPYEKCPSCGDPTLGILSAGGGSLRRRCTKCRCAISIPLPQLSKKVVYLDQFAISEIYKVKSGRRRQQSGAQVFWQEVTRQVDRSYLLQQVIFPGSNIHRDETIVSPWASELALAHEMLSGDVSFENYEDVERSQVIEYAEAYLDGRAAPFISFDVDQILEGDRNDWLPDIHITAGMDYGAFADGIRRQRDETDANCSELWRRWIAQKPTFDQVFAHEFNDFSNAKKGALRFAAERAQAALKVYDTSEFLNRIAHPVMAEFNQLKQLFRDRGIADADLTSSVYRFWDWPENRSMPIHRISAYLFAALSRRLVSGGQRKMPSKGMMNDIRAISTYGPYVDAMFIDNGCASLLSEEPLRSEVKLKARIFSPTTGADFLQYLRDLDLQTPPEVRARAEEIYGNSIR
ncbi:hypothetical protein E4K66_14940 [Bradyrhizobium frederickii]|uniref:Uncharacterized protein n=1 Tax=Bradyrhizobium frederickii TaxID=2560054 RepID=A0A4Y9L799_9BRAD|nr:hypothetical protein [Bradyrhizobium frederickii]TFV38676.1 hypothetical protein E4K66_14940 [Bradyrhizobium frederickii]